MKKGQITIYIILGMIIVIIAGGYLFVANQTKTNSGMLELNPEYQALTQDSVDAMAENILHALNTGDYRSFIKDFSVNLKNSMQEPKFTKLRNTLSITSGKYISKSKPKKIMGSAYNSYSYESQFEKENVQFTMTFTRNGNRVEGINFNSPNIAKIQE